MSRPTLTTALSDRQLQVLQLIADGLPNAEIAERLHIGLSTLTTHIEAVRVRLGARDRAHAVGIAYRTGVLTLDRDQLVAAISTYREQA